MTKPFKHITPAFRLVTHLDTGYSDTQECDLATADTDIEHFEQEWRKGEHWSLQTLTFNNEWVTIDGARRYE